MRRFWVGVAAVGLVVFGAAVGAMGADSVRKQIEVAYRGITIQVNGQQIATPVEPFISVEDGRTFIPARPLAEAMGAKVGWDNATSTVLVYTKDYATHQQDGDLNIWKNPAAGFSLRAPRAFVRVDLSLALLQLTATDPVTQSGNLMIAVQPMEGLSGTGSDRMAVLVYSLRQTLLPDAQTTDVSEANGVTIAHGTAKYLGQDPVNMTLRIVNHGDTDWALIAISPAASATQNQATLDAILNSFQVQQ